ncbi:MAG: glycosyltransferase, partial [Pyrinomonadaceae bacterium]
VEYIIVDDGSKDDTVRKIETSVFYQKYSKTQQCRLIKQGVNKGKGAALKAGVEAASNSYILTLDADLSTSPSELTHFIKHLSPDKILVASREHKDSKITAEKSRKNIGRIFNLMVRCLTPLNLLDTQCGFKAFKMEKFRPLLGLMTIERFGFDVEFLYVAYKKGLRLKEIPVRWNHDERTKVNVLRDSRRMLKEVLQIKRNERKGLYNLNQIEDLEAYECKVECKH